MNNEIKQDLIEKYLSNTLTSEEKAQFEQLQSEDSDFLSEIDFFENLLTTVEVFGDKEFALELKALDEEMELAYQKEQSGAGFSIKGLWDDFIQQIDYTVEQLAALFAPNTNYALLINKINRGEGFEVTSPINELDCLDRILVFRLEGKFKKDLILSIENNRQELLHRSTIAVGTSVFEVNLSEINIHQPGRYYWKLTDGKETLIREFFIRKELLP